MHNKIINKKSLLVGFLLLVALFLAACDENESNETKEKSKTHKVDDNVNNAEEVEAEETEDNEQEQEEYNALDTLNQLAVLSEDTDEIYVTDDIIIGEDEEIGPGIYDLEITGGSGNVMGERSDVMSLFINWVAGAKDNDAGNPSKIRILLFEGDVLELHDISKVKFHAVSEEVEPSKEIGIGEFVVGRDIPPGDYKLSTNVEMDPEFENLGWDITIYNDESGDSREQTFTAVNDDVAVSLKEGEIISTSYDNTDYGSSSDDAKLEFTEID